ncbi:hypothetical protein CVM73_08745 [Bradyrhizobium forestalis]|uniref:Multidrug resistance protein NorM n=2 Tax=Bradyrhizobium forestalis TaxID=1419263 RepID=A0A2M8RCU9_9BRAD|nr:hypothetical protein CVM73_08745 [Bradyrhizobium forestalis]
MLATIPTYFALSDLGFGSAAGSDIAMKAARGEQQEALSTFQSIWLLVNAVSLGLLIIAVASLEGARALQFRAASDHELTILILVLYSAVVMNARIFLVSLRATQNYASGTLLFEIIAFAETLSVLVAARLGSDFLDCALIMVFVRLLNLAIMHRALKRLVPWLRVGFAHGSFDELRRLFLPAVAAMAIPAALAINLQGFVLVTGLLVSASAAAMLTTVRTISRVTVQLVGTINRATMPELSAAGARQQRSTLQKIILLNFASVALILMPGALLLAVIGPELISLWTQGHIQPDWMLVGIISTATVVHGLWYYLSNLLLASNSHTNVSWSLLAISLCSIAIAAPVAMAFGLTGLGSVILLNESISLLAVLRAASKQNIFNATELKAVAKATLWGSR